MMMGRSPLKVVKKSYCKGNCTLPKQTVFSST